MTYYILHNSAGELLGINYSGVPESQPLFDVSVIQIDADPPDLSKYSWDSNTLTLNKIPELIITRLEFMSKFTTAERISIQNSTDAIVQDALDLLKMAEYVNLTDARTIAAVNYFYQIGLIDQSRISEILN